MCLCMLDFGIEFMIRTASINDLCFYLTGGPIVGQFKQAVIEDQGLLDALKMQPLYAVKGHTKTQRGN